MCISIPATSTPHWPESDRNVAPDDRHLAASGIVGAFNSIWRDSWGPRLEHILYNAVAALLDYPNPSLLGVNRMLTDTDYRRRIVAKVRDRVLHFLDGHDETDFPVIAEARGKTEDAALAASLLSAPPRWHSQHFR